MKVSHFYKASACKQAAAFSHILWNMKSRNAILKEAIRIMCQRLSSGVSTEEIADELNRFLSERYTPDIFDFPRIKDKYLYEDSFILKRFLDWYRSAAAETVAADISCTFEDSDVQLKQNVNLIFRSTDGTYTGLVIFFSKRTFSMRGRSLHTNVSTRLEMLVPKFCLEGQYPGIKIACAVLELSEDKHGLLPVFNDDGKKQSNLMLPKWNSSEYDSNVLKQKIVEVYNTPVSKNCSICLHASLCKQRRLTHTEQSDSVATSEPDSDKPSVKVSSFTDEQNRVISFNEGALLVCAPPGSGKTACLVGRTKHLIDSGVHPENILLITFANKAAEELKTRIVGSKGGSQPTITTLNALGYSILRHNQNALGRKVSLLTTSDELRLIDSLLTSMPLIKGFNYSVKGGSYGVLNTALNRAHDYWASGKIPSDCGEDFIEFAETLRQMELSRNAITFDEQISMAVDLLNSNPEIRERYNRIWRYVMVDEFQDIDSRQEAFIELLAGSGNIVAVGDDDQSIYGFRNGTNKYMHEFGSNFPGAKRIVLSKNFRSSESIVSLSDGLIRENSVRIDKEIKAVVSGGINPELYRSSDANTLKTLIDNVLSKGFGYGDIAIIGRKNAILETLQKELKDVPSYLAKNRLIDEPLFVAILSSLSYCLSGGSDRESLLKLELALTNLDIEQLSMDISGECFQLIRDILSFTEKAIIDGITAESYVRAVSEMLSLSGSTVEETILTIIEKKNIRKIDDFSLELQFMVHSGDEIKTDPADAEQKVTLITSHESKGREWPVCIVINADDYDAVEEDRRLLYVALTRAKKVLYICSTDGKPTLINNFFVNGHLKVG